MDKVPSIPNTRAVRQDDERAVSARLSENLSRVICAIDTSMRLVSDSMRRREQRNRDRSATTLRGNPDEIVWSDAEHSIVCRLITRTSFLHEVEVTVNSVTIVTQVFHDPVEAADEVSRLRCVFLGNEPRRPQP